MDEIDGFYQFDPSAGLICTCCKYPVACDKRWSLKRCIRRHEEISQNHKNHRRRPSTDDEINYITTNFQKYINNCVAKIKECLTNIPDELHVSNANELFLSYVGSKQDYDYCLACEVLIMNKDIHNQRKCKKDQFVKRQGVKNEYNIFLNPTIILVDGFNITVEAQLERYTCRTFQEVWRNNGGTTSGPNLVIDKNASDFFTMLQRRALVYTEGNEQVVVQPIDNSMTPNLYVTRLRWDAALKDCQFGVIDSMKYKDRNGEFEDDIELLLERFDDALWYGLSKAKTISGLHPVLGTLGTKDGGITDTNLNILSKTGSWSQYFGHINRICLFIFRLQNTENSFHNFILPTVDFSMRQLELLHQCLAKQEDDDESCHQLHLNFLLSLIDQDIGDISYQCPLIAAVAMLSIDKKSFMSAKKLSPIIAGIITTYRMLLLYKCLAERQENAHTLNKEEYNGYLQKIAYIYAKKYLYINNKEIDSNPMRELIKTLSIVMNDAKSLDGEEKLMWSTDKEMVTYIPTGFNFPMSLYPTCSNAAVVKAKGVLLKMLGYNDLPTIPWKTIHDDPSNNEYGHSFLQDFENKRWVKSEYYQQQILATKSKWWDNGSIDKGAVDAFAKLIDQFRLILLPLIHVTAGMPPRGTEVTNLTFANTAQSIRNIFIERGCVHIRTLYHKTLVHTQKYKPISRYLRSNVGELLVYYLWLILPFWQLVLGLQNEAKKCSHFLLSNYIVLKDDTIIDTIWDTTKLSKCLKVFFVKEDANVQSYRQIAKGVFEEKLYYFIDDDEEVESENRLFDLQAAHTTRTAKKNYAITDTLSRKYKHFYDLSSAWHEFVFGGGGGGDGGGGTSSASNVSGIGGVTTTTNTLLFADSATVPDQAAVMFSGDGGGGGGGTSSASNVSGIGGVTTTTNTLWFDDSAAVADSVDTEMFDASAFDADITDAHANAFDFETVAIDDAFDANMNVFTAINVAVGSGSIYNEILNRPNSLNAEHHYSNLHNEDHGKAFHVGNDAVFHDESGIDMEMLVHDVNVGCREDSEPNVLTYPMNTGSYLYYERCIQRRTKQMETSEDMMTRLLRKIVKNPNAAFRGNQLSTIKSIVRYESECILQICGTGIGKSLSFILPAMLSHGGVSIVITPLVALQRDHINNAFKGGITNAIIWQGTAITDDHPALIFITPEAFVARPFQLYLNQLKNFYLLDRIVVDECHLVLEASHNFRSAMKDMIDVIKRVAVQVVLLTATLPFVQDRNIQALLSKFKSTFKNDSVAVYRAPTIRTNIHYIVENIDNTYEHMHSAILTYIEKHLGETTIIYVPYKDSGEEIQLYLKNIYPGNEFHFYHSKANGKEEMLVNWMHSTMKVIIATTALGCGLNVSNVRLVIHAGAPFSLTDFVQGSGRAGRDGLDSCSVLIHSLGKKLSAKMEQQHNTNGMAEFLHTTGCRRGVIDKYIDGNETRVNGCGIGELPCDNCCRCKSVDCDTEEAFNDAKLVGQRTITPIVEEIPRPVSVAPIVLSFPVPLEVHPIQLQEGISANRISKPLAIAVKSFGNPKVRVIEAKNLFIPSVPTTTSSSCTNSITPLMNNVDRATNTIRTEIKGRQLIQTFVDQTVLYDDKIRSFLDFFVNPLPNKCLICKVLGQIKCDQSHYKRRKNIETKRKAVSGVVSNQNQNRTADQFLPKYIICYRPGCFLPQSICPVGGSRCDYRDIVLDVVLILMEQYPDAASFVYSQVGTEGSHGNDNTIYRLLTQVLEHNNKFLLLHEVFLKLCHAYVTTDL